VVDRGRKVLLTHMLVNGEPITVADFRNLIDGNRRICLLLINQFDKEGVTSRDGDNRKLTRKGQALAEQLLSGEGEEQA